MFEDINLDFGMDAVSEYNSAWPYIPEASDCMRCGMCISTCPTYRLFQIDEETPRRRIATIRKILVENSPISVDEQQHLQNCLQCRACEPACPSRMAYGQLFDQAQAKLAQERPTPWLANLAFRCLEHKRAISAFLPLIALYLRSGLQKAARASGLLGKLNLVAAEEVLSKPVLTSLSGVYPVKKRKMRGRVALFTGCLAEHFDTDTLKAAIKLLNSIGYEVVVPEGQGCCGAIHQHNGRSAQALIDKNIEVFYALDVEAIIYTASGCGAMLAEYQHQDEESSGWFNRYLYDINQFLLAHWPEDLQPAASNLNVAVHEPCSQRNVLKNTQAVYALLHKIPGLNIAPLPDNALCCGAGGSYMLTHPENANSLRQLKHQAIEGCGADLVVSCNFGCMLYLNAKASRSTVRVLHPIRLLADRL